MQGMTFRWRFSPKEHDSTLAVYGPISGYQPLLIILRGWQDPWLAFSAANTNEPTVIGPNFVSQAVIYGLGNGWLPSQAGPAMRVDYEGGKFSARRNNAV